MAQGAKVLGCKHDNAQFPILCEVRGVRVYKNPTDEIFIENIETGVTMRLKASCGGLEFTSEGRVEPIQVSNMIGWRVGRRI